MTNVSINIISNNFVKRRIESKEQMFQITNGLLRTQKFFDFSLNGEITKKYENTLEFNSFYNVEKLNNLFKNLDTISFYELITSLKINF